MTPEDALELFAAVPSGILSVTRQGVIRGGNFAASRLLDRPLKSLPGLSLLEIARPDERAALAALLREERFDERELPLRSPDGKASNLRASGRPLPDGSLAIVLRDAHLEAAQLQRRVLAEKMAALGHLAAGVGHEFGNVMATLFGFAQLAERDPAMKDDLVAAVRDAAGRVQQVTDALRAFERGPTGELAALDLSELAAKVLSVLRGEIEKAQVRVERSLETRAPISGHRPTLEEAVIAVVRNAIDACRGGGTVTVSVTADAERAVLSVSDTGPGIPPEIQDRIFDPFFTTKGSLGGGAVPSSGTGLGLGLAVSWNRLREQAGELDFETTPGQGTTFRITLPTRRESGARRDVAPEPARRTTGQRRRHRSSILVVDAEASSRAFVEAVLRSDHWVRTVASGSEALAAYDAPRAFEYVVLDAALEGSPSGIEVFRTIRERDPRARIVLLSARLGEDEGVKACASQAYALLKKPEGLRDLRELLA